MVEQHHIPAEHGGELQQQPVGCLSCEYKRDAWKQRGGLAVGSERRHWNSDLGSMADDTQLANGQYLEFHHECIHRRDAHYGANHRGGDRNMLWCDHVWAMPTRSERSSIN